MRIHLHSRKGVYKVLSYDSETINLATRSYNLAVDANDFKAFAGGHWNWDIPVEKMDKFLSVVQPERYNAMIEKEAELLKLINYLQAEEKKKKEEDELELEYEEPDYEKYWKNASDEVYTLNRKLQDIAYQVCSNHLNYSTYENTVGKKFIIQQSRLDENEYRFRFDPYGFVSNGHSAISGIFMLDNWSTINGGWLRTFDNKVILYAQSGDYGVYDDRIATQCAEKIFPGKEILSFAGKQWDNIPHNKYK